MAAQKLRVSDLSPFEDAAAGHDGVLSDPTGDLIIKPCTAAEIAFYEQCNTHPIFNAVIPTYMGTLALSSESEKQALESGDGAVLQEASLAFQASDGAAVKATTLHGKRLDTQQAIVLENVAGGFHKPNVLDVKLGIRLWGDDAPPAKRNKFDQISSETTSGSLGLRIAGMRVWESGAGGRGGQYAVYDKTYGRQFTDHDIRLGFEEFFYEKKGEGPDKIRELTSARREVLWRLANEVGSIQEVLENEESRMYSASILFAYEGDSEVLDALLVEEQNPQSVRRGDSRRGRPDDQEGQKSEEGGDVGEDDDDDDDEDDEGEIRVCAASLIDFAHASFTPGQGPDENALRGVRNVRAILESML